MTTHEKCMYIFLSTKMKHLKNSLNTRPILKMQPTYILKQYDLTKVENLSTNNSAPTYEIMESDISKLPLTPLNKMALQNDLIEQLWKWLA